MSVKNIVGSGKSRVYKILSKHLMLYRIIAAVIAFVLIIGVVFFVNAMLGYPLNYPFAKMKVEKYIAENYGSEGYVLKSFEDYNSDYFAEAVKPGSPDGHFSVYYHYSSDFIGDTYDLHILKKLNTINRLDKRYNDFVKTVFESPLFPYSIKYTDQGLYFKSDRHGSSSDDGGIPKDILVLDGLYDIQELGEMGGYLDITINTDQLTPEFAAEALLKIDSFLKRGGVTYYSIDLRLQDPALGAGENNIYDLKNFLRSDIYEEGLVERVILNADKS